MKLYLFLLLCLLFSTPAVAQPMGGKVVSVIDGDTITILDQNKRQHKVRLLGIDAPESKQDFGQVARQHLADLILGKQVVVISNKSTRNGPKPGKVMIDDRDINLEQLHAACAWYYRQDAAEMTAADREIYDRAEQEAKTAKRGLWQQPNPMPPWQWKSTEQRSGRTVTVHRDQTTDEVPNLQLVVGNRSSKVYHRPGCPGYKSVSAKNRVAFLTAEEAEEAGYKKAGNCPK